MPPMTALLFVRLALAVACLGLALPVVIPFQSLTGWKLTLISTEYGHRLAVAAALLGLAGYHQGGTVSRLGSVLLLFAVLLWFIPLMRAIGIGERLPPKMGAIFPLREKETAPDFRGLWWSVKPVAKEPTVMTFHEDENGPRRLFFYHAAKTAKAPCIVLFHSGGWENGSATEFPEWSLHWAEMGFAVASVEYRLAPKHTWPTPLDDARLAIDWLKTNATRLGITDRCFIIAGRSAGGQIASAVAYGLKDPAIKGCIAFYGPHDMFFARRHAYEDDVLNSLRLLRNYLGGDAEEKEATYTSASGMLLADKSSCPTLLIHGTRDALVWNMQSYRLALRLRELGVRHYLLELPWATHAMDWPFDGPSGQLIRYTVDRYLRFVSPTALTEP